MPVVVSLVKGGSLTFTAADGAVANTPKDWSCQYTSVAITPSTDTGAGGGANNEEVLCGDFVPTSESAAGQIGKGDTLDFTVVSDHNVGGAAGTIDGLIAFSWYYRGKVVAFEFTPAKSPTEAGASAQTFRGTVLMQPLTIGGQVAGDLRINGSLPIVSLTPPQAYGTGYSPSKSYAMPGVRFSSDAAITAEDTANADSMLGLGYQPVPRAAWARGTYIEIESPTAAGTYFKFHWDNTAGKWAPGSTP